MADIWVPSYKCKYHKSYLKSILISSNVEIYLMKAKKDFQRKALDCRQSHNSKRIKLCLFLTPHNVLKYNKNVMFPLISLQ